MLYGAAQSGGNLSTPGLNITALEPGSQLTLLSGTEAIVSGSASVSFSLAYHEGGGFPVTFNISGCPAGSIIEVEGAGADVAGDYTVFATITPDANGNAAYTDSGASPYRRVVVSTYVSPDVPVVTVSR